MMDEDSCKKGIFRRLRKRTRAAVLMLLALAQFSRRAEKKAKSIFFDLLNDQVSDSYIYLSRAHLHMMRQTCSGTYIAQPVSFRGREGTSVIVCSYFLKPNRLIVRVR
jgi:hypothetical protein